MTDEIKLPEATPEATNTVAQAANQPKVPAVVAKKNPTMTSATVLNSPVTRVSQPPQQEIQDMDKPFMVTLSEEDAIIASLNEADFMHEAIVAKPMAIPHYLDVKAKDPLKVVRWFNHKGHEGERHQYALSFGFVNAQPEDIEEELDRVKIKIVEGAIVCQDLILMITSKRLLFGKYKQNVLQANMLVGKENVHNQALNKANKEFNESMRSSGISPNLARGKVAFFKPNQIPGD